MRFVYLIAHVLEQSDRIRGKTAIDVQLVRFPLMVDAGKIDGILYIHSKINQIDYHRNTAVTIVGPPGAPSTRNSLPSLSG